MELLCSLGCFGSAGVSTAASSDDDELDDDVESESDSTAVSSGN